LGLDQFAFQFRIRVDAAKDPVAFAKVRLSGLAIVHAPGEARGQKVGGSVRPNAESLVEVVLGLAELVFRKALPGGAAMVLRRDVPAGEGSHRSDEQEQKQDRARAQRMAKDAPGQEPERNARARQAAPERAALVRR